MKNIDLYSPKKSSNSYIVVDLEVNQIISNVIGTFYVKTDGVLFEQQITSHKSKINLIGRLKEEGINKKLESIDFEINSLLKIENKLNEIGFSMTDKEMFLNQLNNPYLFCLNSYERKLKRNHHLLH